MSNTYQPSNLGGAPVATAGYMVPLPAQPSRPVTPTPPAPATSTTYAPSFPVNPAQASGLSGAIEHHESGGNPHAVSPSGAIGYRQIMPGTFKQFALPGENINNPDDNRRVGDRILNHYLQIYNGDTARAAVAYFSGPGNVAPPGSPTPWIRNTGDGNNTVAQYVANTAGKVGAYAGKPQSSAPSAPSAAPPAQPADNLMALAALSQSPGGGQKSTMDNLQSMFPSGGGGDQPQLQNNLQAQQAAAAGNIRQQQIAQRAAQLSAGLAQYAAQPLSWSSAPMGSTAGPQRPLMQMAGQQTPGTTLNSMGGQGYV